MRLSFRQGIVRCPPNFLELSNGSVSVVVPHAESVVVTFADNASNYLLTERLSVANAWPGPFPTGAQTYWLYWDLNMLTGLKTYGHTTLEPIEGATAPVNPQNDQHWYDTGRNRMVVWSVAANRWQQKVRVFAAQLTGNGIFISMSIHSPSFIGTQTGILAAVDVNAGALVFDADGKVLKRNNGTFFTTEDVVVTGVASSSQVKVGGILVEAEAQTNIPKFTVVQFTDFNKIKTANSTVLNTAPYGLTNQDAAVGDIVSVAMEGVITNPDWDWSSLGINAPLFVDNNGQLTGVEPLIPIVIGYVVDRDVVLINSSTTVIGQGSAQELPPIGQPNQVLGVNPGGSGLEYKTLAGKDGITIAHTPALTTIGIDVIDCGTF